jgi:hypothetical protein
MKKNNLLYIGIAGAALYFILNPPGKKNDAEKKAETKDIATEVESATGEEVSAVVKTPAGKINEGIEQAKQIAESVKSGVVAVKDLATGTTAVVRAEKRTARKASRTTKRTAKKAKRTARKTARKAKRTARRAARTQPGEYTRVPVREEYQD